MNKSLLNTKFHKKTILFKSITPFNAYKIDSFEKYSYQTDRLPHRALQNQAPPHTAVLHDAPTNLFSAEYPHRLSRIQMEMFHVAVLDR